MNTTPGATIYPPSRSSNGNVPPNHSVGPVHHHFNYHPPLSSYRFSPYSLPPIYIDKAPQQSVPQLSHHVLDLHSTNGHGAVITNSKFGGDLCAGSSGSSRSPSAGTLYSPVTDKDHSDTMAVLTEKELWKSFDSVGSEMIVTKPGRRLFPTILVTVTGLIPSVQYTIKVRFVSADKYRHKYITGHWTAVGESDIIHDESKMVFIHPSSPCYGEMWLKKPISFKSIKITHHNESQNGNILLHTMHKYRIEVVIKPHEEHMSEMIFPLAHSEFTAVTSYQSSAITKLKVDNNPFAKGFRDREVFTTQYNHSGGNYSPFLSPPYTPFLHPSLWTASNGSVFPSMSSVPSMFPSTVNHNTPSLVPSPATQQTTTNNNGVLLLTESTAQQSSHSNGINIMSPTTSMQSSGQPTMFQPFLPTTQQSTSTISTPLFQPTMSNVPLQSSTTCCSHILPHIFTPPTVSLSHQMYNPQTATSLPVFSPMTTIPLMPPPLTTSVPLQPLSPSSPASSSSSRTYSAFEGEEGDQKVED